MSVFAVFGNPIKHSKSAKIYALFAKESGILEEEYDLKLISKEEDFDCVLYNFFKLGGMGANITVPFKERAFLLCDQLTKRAKLACSINVIKKQHDGSLLGDNTDGIGFIKDLERLNWIVNNRGMYIIKETKTEEKVLSIKNVLLIGSGGAAKGVVSALLNISHCNINIVNRTYARAQSLVQFYRDRGYKNIFCVPLNIFNYNNQKKYDLIINATSSSMYGTLPAITSSVITAFTRCYDLFYQRDKTSFLIWCQKNGSEYCADGLGMLVEQAAYSFLLWHNLFPTNVVSVLSYLRSIL